MMQLDRSLADAPNDAVPTPEIEAFLAGIQGNILRSHGRDHAVYLLVRFPQDNAAGVRGWLAAAANGTAGLRITSALEQKQQADRRRASAVAPEEVFASVLLSAHGCDYLGVAHPAHPPFEQGMIARRDRIGDSTTADWDAGYQQGGDSLILIAADDPGLLQTAEDTARSELAQVHGEVVAREAGDVLRENGESHEHFGFADGISQPDFFAAARADLPYDPQAPLDLVLAPEPGSDGWGSFAVFRKIEQDVAGWNAALEQVTRVRTGGSATPEEIELTGALAVGRFQDGTPVVASAAAQGATTPPNTFDYSADANGRKCPFHAHIRKTNPRGGSIYLTPAEERRRRIARRGIAYQQGERAGMLFLAYQSQIDAQFEAIIRIWCANPSSPRQGTGADQLIGNAQSAAAIGPAVDACWPATWDGDGKRAAFGNFVQLRGGDYFYAPSMAGLRKLA